MPLSSSFTDTPRDCYSAAVEPGTTDEARPSTWRTSHKRVASLPRRSFSKVSPAPRSKTFPSPSPFSPAKPSSTRYERSISSRVLGTCVAFFTSQTSRSDQPFVFSLRPRKKAAPHRPGHHRRSVGSASLPSSDSCDRFCAAREWARKQFRPALPPLPDDLDVPLGPVHADKGPIRNRLGRSIDPDHRRDAVLAGDDGPVGHEPPNFGHEARRQRKERRPGGIGVRCDQDFALFEL